MKISYLEPLRRGWDRMVEILFRPFDLKTWFVMGFGAWLANLTNGGGGGGTSGSSGVSDAVESGAGELLGEVLEAVEQLPGWILILAAAGCVVVVALVVLALWLSARGKFIFLDNVVRGEARIRAPWREYRQEGNSLFGWLVAYFVACVLTLGLVLAVFAGALPAPRWILVVAGGILLAVWIMAVLYINLFLDSFLAPIMYRRRLSVWSAWKEFLGLLEGNRVHLVLYGLFVFALALIGLAAILAFGLLTCCIGLILLLLPYLGTVLTLPLWVTYRAFGVYWLAQLDPDLDLFARSEETVGA